MKRSRTIASGRVACSQNAPSPPARELQTSAASGSRTTRLRYPVATPRASAPETAGRGRGRSSTATSVAKRPLDLGHNAVVGIEEAAGSLRPAALPPLLRADREQPRRLHEVV